MKEKAGIEMAFKVPGWEHINAWVSLEDSLALIQDQMLYGNAYIKEITDRGPEAMVTHQRIAPSDAAKLKAVMA